MIYAGSNHANWDKVSRFTVCEKENMSAGAESQAECKS